MPEKIVREAKAAAARRGTTLSKIVAEALARDLTGKPDSRTHARTANDLDADMQWYKRNRATLPRRYRGENIAVLGGEVVDYDRESGPLAERVFARKRGIFMPQVLPEDATIRVRSPRVRSR